MERCKQCGTETILYVKGVPICIDCDAKLNSRDESRGNQRPAGPKSPAGDPATGHESARLP